MAQSIPQRTEPLPHCASRRSFIAGSGMMLAGGAMPGSHLDLARCAHGYGSDLIKIGLVGCGSRGTAAAVQALNTSGGELQLVAMADVFENNIQKAYRTIKGQHASKMAVDRRRFVGLDAYRELLQTDCDLVILATPPGFRPLHFGAAVRAGKHVFMEKPVATDAPGVRRILAANLLARQQGLAVQVGLQRRHELRYQACIEQLQNGAIGDLLFARVYWNGGRSWSRERQPGQGELEYQIRNWYGFNWLSGDQIGEQHIHNLDVINWLFAAHPLECQGQGGREVNTAPDDGQTFDHHLVEYTYPGGRKLFSQCRRIAGCWNHVGEHVQGTDGRCDIGKAIIYDRHGKVRWKSNATEPKGKGWQQEQHDLLASLRRGERPNETERGAESTLTAIMGRMATYGGKLVSWDQAAQSSIMLVDTDSLRSLQDAPPLLRGTDGRYPAPQPGATKSV